jgi:fatty-acyl-CoA synthase
MAMSYACGPADVPLLGETIGANFAATVARAPGAEALVDVASGRRWAYSELAADVDRVSRSLLALGVAKGDRVGIWAGNCPEWVIVQYASARIGAILVTINPAYRSEELAYVLRQAGVRTLVSAERLRNSEYRAMIAQVRDECPQLREVVYLGTERKVEMRAVAIAELGLGSSAGQPAQLPA